MSSPRSSPAICLALGTTHSIGSFEPSAAAVNKHERRTFSLPEVFTNALLIPFILI
jgi:hypothetical protein